jgi:integrase
MSSKRGSLIRRKGVATWTMKFYVDGREKRESTGASDRDEALEILKRRVDDASHGRHIDASRRISFDEMCDLLVRNYAFKRNRTKASHHFRRLREFFGRLRGEQIDEARITAYSLRRLEVDRVAPSTLRRELAILKRMLRLAAPHLPRVPLVDLPRVDNARQGFFEESELQTILPHLPPHARHLVEFLYLTGWRSGEATSLVWGDVDWKSRLVCLRTSKNREPRIFPFKYHARLEEVLRHQRAFVSRWELASGCMCAAVFPWKGMPMKKLRRSWTTACRKAGLPGRLLHDFRRTAVRNLIRAGVQQAIAMKITGHKTDSVFRRYLIVDEELLAQATGAVAELLEEERRERDRERPEG